MLEVVVVDDAIDCVVRTELIWEDVVVELDEEVVEDEDEVVVELDDEEDDDDEDDAAELPIYWNCGE